jgi:hypothetical protein
MVGGEADIFVGREKPNMPFFAMSDENGVPVLEQMVDYAKLFNSNVNVSPPYDGSGNIRELKVLWRSRKRLKYVTSYDPTTGLENEKWRTEDYVPDTSKGEKVKIVFANEWYMGYKLGDKILRAPQVKVWVFNK